MNLSLFIKLGRAFGLFSNPLSSFYYIFPFILRTCGVRSLLFPKCQQMQPAGLSLRLDQDINMQVLFGLLLPLKLNQLVQLDLILVILIRLFQFFFIFTWKLFSTLVIKNFFSTSGILELILHFVHISRWFFIFVSRQGSKYICSADTKNCQRMHSAFGSLLQQRHLLLLL